MTKFLRRSWLIVCFLAFAVYLISCLTPFVNPEHFSLLGVFALLFPYIFLGAFLCTASLLFYNKKIAVFLLLLLFVAGFKNLSNTVAINTTGWQMEKDTNALRVMTWNVEDFINLYPQSSPLAQTRVQMLKAIQKYNPDILCLQEYIDVFSDGWMNISPKKELDSLGYKYSYVSNDSVNKTWLPAIVYQGSAIYSKTPLVDTNRINIRHIFKTENIVFTDITLHKRKVRIFTGHLSSLGLYNDTVKTGNNKNIYQLTYERKHRIEYMIREKEIEHEKQVGIIRKAITQSPYPVIYCGDINSTPTTYTYNKLKENLQDAFLEKGFGLGGTFYKLPSTIRIDVCLPDNKLKVLQCTVPQLYLSDHFPVVTDLAWK